MDKVAEIIRELEYNIQGNRRYKTIFLVASTPTEIELTGIIELLHAVQEGLLGRRIPCQIIDLFKDVVAKGEIPLGHTGNSSDDLIDWLKQKSELSQQCLLIHGIDPLLSSWTDSDIKGFLIKVLHHDGIRMPVLLVSNLAGRFSLPKETKGQGLVIDQYDEEDL